MKKNPANPEHREAVDYFCSTHRKVLNRPYFFSGGKDGKMVQIVLGFAGLAGFKALVDIYFEKEDLSYWRDDEKVEIVHSLSNMVYNLNYLRARPHFNRIEAKHNTKPDSALEQIAKLKEIPRGMSGADHQNKIVEAHRKLDLA